MIVDLIVFSGAMCGAIVCGFVMLRATPNTKWGSKIGKWGMIGMILLVVSMSVMFYRAVDGISNDARLIRVSYSRGVDMHYGWCFQPTGYYNWGMCYGPKSSI